MTDTRKVLLILALGLILTTVISTVEAGVNLEMGFFNTGSTTSTCRGSATIGECDDVDDFELDTEVHRRILATGSYISYGALNRNRVPCSKRGASYYNCRPGAQANPYSRGCTAISRCRRS